MKNSIFITEVCGVDLALNKTFENKHNKFIIFSDSLSVLKSLRNKKLENPLIVKLVSILNTMSSQKEIIRYWIPSHIGVSGNERADSAAKSALDLRPGNISIPYTNLKPQINIFFLTKWQQRRNNHIHNKLFQIKPTLREWRLAFRKSRKEKVIIYLDCGLVTRLIHSFILRQGQPPQCLTWQTPYTIKHVLVECGALAITRDRHFKTDNMRDMFENVHMDDVLSFLRDVKI